MVAPSVTINREELYERVWQMPMRLVGEALGVSPVEISRMCRRLKVPTPPLGFWTQRELGRRSSNAPPPLPLIERGELRSILVRRTDGQGWTEQEISDRKAMLDARNAVMRRKSELPKEYDVPAVGTIVTARLVASPRRGLRREEAALYIGISASKFDQLVRDGRMPKPVRIDGCVVWDLRKLDTAFDALMDEDDSNPWDAANPLDAALNLKRPTMP